MLIPLQVTFRGMDPSQALEQEITKRSARLERFQKVVTSCRVVVERPHHKQRQGQLYHVRVDLTVPGSEIIIRRDPAEHHAHEDVYVAIRDAFDAAKRQLQDHARARRKQVKVHEEPAIGRVRMVSPLEGFGIIATADGREVYFHENSLLGTPIARIDEGQEVRFVEELGEKGPQASTVKIVRRRRSASSVA